MLSGKFLSANKGWSLSRFLFQIVCRTSKLTQLPTLASEEQGITMMRHLCSSLIAVALCVCLTQAAEPDKDGFVQLFDGKSLDNWEKVGREESVWEVKDGAICGSGPASMLVCTQGPYKNFRYRAEIKINDKGNSGMYFRTTRKPVFSDGYEAQIDSTHGDPIRTGSIYNFCHVYKRLVEPDTWFNYELQVRDGVWRGKPSLRVDTLKELRSMTLSQLKDDHQRSLANDLFKEFAAGQIKNAIVGIEKTSNLLRRMAA